MLFLEIALIPYHIWALVFYTNDDAKGGACLHVYLTASWTEMFMSRRSRSHMRVTDVRPSISILLILRNTVTRSNRLLTHPKYSYSRQIHNLGSTGEDSVGFLQYVRSTCEKQIRISVIGVMWGIPVLDIVNNFIRFNSSHNCNSLRF